MNIELAVLTVATITGAAFDLRTSKIPNALTGTLAVIALALHVPNGIVAVVIATATMVVAFLAGSLVFSLGWLGGGDVKIIAAACGLVGYPGAMWLVCDILIAGAVLAIVQAAISRRLVDLFRSAYEIAQTGRSPRTGIVLPYGVAIAGGSIGFTLSALFAPARFTP